ncbi:MAG: hypothetical protein EU532_08320 [Promethearchaeota archaeon]|nr:MAG: hypothetical protein EU532_08320 [Candidatus Lokiarchaeota archaeon]
MRIKVFEEKLSVESMFNIIKKTLKSQNSISKKSQMLKDSFLLIGTALKNYIFIIRSSTDNSKERIILTLLVFDINSIKKVLKSKKDRDSIENHLYDLIINETQNRSLNPLKRIIINGLAKLKYNKKILAIERNILNQILPDIYEELNYKDDLKNYPFSIFNLDRTLEFWLKIYGTYLNKIENNFIKSSPNLIKVYKYYDFALPKELVQRIFDLVLLENEVEIETEEELTDNSKEASKWIVFVYNHKKLKPMRLMEVLKLTQEIGKYSQLLNKQNQKMKTETKTLIILVSTQGYEKTVGRYLRDNVFHDFKHVFPMLIVPPINKDIWHNFKAIDGLSQQEEEAKKRAKRFIKIHKSNSKSYNYMRHNIQDAKEHYSELIEKEKKVKENIGFINKWAEILNINRSNDLLNSINNQNRIEKDIKILYE